MTIINNYEISRKYCRIVDVVLMLVIRYVAARFGVHVVTVSPTLIKCCTCNAKVATDFLSLLKHLKQDVWELPAAKRARRGP